VSEKAVPFALLFQEKFSIAFQTSVCVAVYVEKHSLGIGPRLPFWTMSLKNTWRNHEFIWSDALV